MKIISFSLKINKYILIKFVCRLKRQYVSGEIRAIFKRFFTVPKVNPLTKFPFTTPLFLRQPPTNHHQTTMAAQITTDKPSVVIPWPLLIPIIERFCSSQNINPTSTTFVRSSFDKCL
jgi:hypothetical protein